MKISSCKIFTRKKKTIKKKRVESMRVKERDNETSLCVFICVKIYSFYGPNRWIYIKKTYKVNITKSTTPTTIPNTDSTILRCSHTYTKCSFVAEEEKNTPKYCYLFLSLFVYRILSFKWNVFKVVCHFSTLAYHSYLFGTQT